MIVTVFNTSNELIATFKTNKIVSNDLDAIPNIVKIRIRVGFTRSSPSNIQSIKDIRWVLELDEKSKKCIKRHEIRPEDLPSETVIELERCFSKAKSGYTRYQRCCDEDIMTLITEYIRTKYTFLVWDSFLTMVGEED